VNTHDDDPTLRREFGAGQTEDLSKADHRQQTTAQVHHSQDAGVRVRDGGDVLRCPQDFSDPLDRQRVFLSVEADADQFDRVLAGGGILSLAGLDRLDRVRPADRARTANSLSTRR
jgi:hypothetical protein